jgi:hypothetical protein
LPENAARGQRRFTAKSLPKNFRKKLDPLAALVVKRSQGNELPTALVASMESDGELIGRDEQPESGGHITRIFAGAKK